MTSNLHNCLRLLGRMLVHALVDAVIGVAVVALFFFLDYATQKRAERELYFVDRGSTIVLLLIAGAVIGALIGLVWAVVRGDQNKQRGKH